ncbi:hypothetical protein K439DRAFT_1370332, partial [Ramaria rubella]
WEIESRLQTSEETVSQYQAITSELLSAAIIESSQLGGSLLDKFWNNLADCHPKLKDNGIYYSTIPEVLMQGLHPAEIDSSPILSLAAEVFTHLGVTFLHHEGLHSKNDTPFSVGELDRMEMDALLTVPNADGKFGHRKEAVLIQLATRHDGNACMFTKKSFNPAARGFCNADLNGIDHILAHIIPHSLHQKSNTLALISTFAGEKTAKVVLEHSNSPMNIQSDAHQMYGNLFWGIEAQERDGTVKYVYRRVSRTVITDPGPGFILLKDGDEMKFGQGPEGETLGNGPLPLLCNLHLAVARVILTSGAASIIAQWIDEADDTDFPHVYVASDAFFKILTARLQLVT